MRYKHVADGCELAVASSRVAELTFAPPTLTDQLPAPCCPVIVLLLLLLLSLTTATKHLVSLRGRDDGRAAVEDVARTRVASLPVAAHPARCLMPFGVCIS